MKSKQKKQEDLSVLTEQFRNSKSAIMLSFNGLTVNKDQQFRNELRETGATYKVVKNTLARIAVKDTSYEKVAESFKGVTSVVWTNREPVDLSKIISKYVREYKNVFEFKTGVIDGKVVDLSKIKTIANLPSKKDLIAKLLYVLNSPARGVATALNAIPRGVAIVVKQISEDRKKNADNEELVGKKDQSSEVDTSAKSEDVNKKEEAERERGTDTDGKKPEGDHKEVDKDKVD